MDESINQEGGRGNKPPWKTERGFPVLLCISSGPARWLSVGFSHMIRTLGGGMCSSGPCCSKHWSVVEE